MPQSAIKPGPVSKRLKALREKKELSITAAALAADVAENTVKRFEVAYEPAPNHPLLARLAKLYKVPLDELTKGTTGVPLTSTELARLDAYLVTAQGKRDKRRPAYKRAGFNNTPRVDPAKASRAVPAETEAALAPLVAWAKLPDLAALVAKTGIDRAWFRKLARGDVAPNSPYIDRLAERLDVPRARIATLAKLPPMSEVHVKRIASMFRNGTKTGQSRKPTKLKASTGNGRGRGYNRVRGGALNVRQAARTLANTLNTAIMAGERTIPPIPCAEFSLLLRDYFEAKGIRGTLVLDADFATIFDK